MPAHPTLLYKPPSPPTLCLSFTLLPPYPTLTPTKMATKIPHSIFLFFLSLSASFTPLHSASPYPKHQSFKLHPSSSTPSSLTPSKKFEGSSDLVQLRYHMGPVLTSPINVYLIWYGKWAPAHKLLIKDFIHSITPVATADPSPSVSQWWQTVSLYTDQTGANITKTIKIAGEFTNTIYSHGTHLTRLSIQQVVGHAVSGPHKMTHLPIDHKNGIYLVLTSPDVYVQDFCRAVCGFHYFTFPSIVGYTLPYAWVGNSGKQCPEVCAYPFAIPSYMAGAGALVPPNGDVGLDGMISVIGHELAELSSNPLVNAWYAGEDPTAPTEIADLCEGLYGTGGGGGYIGQVMSDRVGRKYNLNGRSGRKFLVQWIWNPVLKACAGPNALD